MKVFKVNMSVVYNDDEITENAICDNLFQSMSQINNKMVVLNIDDIKTMARPNQAVAKMMKDIMKEPFENIKNIKADENEYFEVNKSSSSNEAIEEVKTPKTKRRKNKKNENKN